MGNLVTLQIVHFSTSYHDMHQDSIYKRVIDKKISATAHTYYLFFFMIINEKYGNLRDIIPRTFLE